MQIKGSRLYSVYRYPDTNNQRPKKIEQDDDRWKRKNKKKKKGKKKIYDPARRASEQPWNATNVEEEYAVIATGWNEQVLC